MDFIVHFAQLFLLVLHSRFALKLLCEDWAFGWGHTLRSGYRMPLAWKNAEMSWGWLR